MKLRVFVFYTSRQAIIDVSGRCRHIDPRRCCCPRTFFIQWRMSMFLSAVLVLHSPCNGETCLLMIPFRPQPDCWKLPLISSSSKTSSRTFSRNQSRARSGDCNHSFRLFFNVKDWGSLWWIMDKGKMDFFVSQKHREESRRNHFQQRVQQSVGANVLVCLLS